MAVYAIRRAEFAIEDQLLVAVEVSDGKVELYQVDPADGIEMWAGYVSNPSIPAVARIRAVEALARVPRREPDRVHRW